MTAGEFVASDGAQRFGQEHAAQTDRRTSNRTRAKFSLSNLDTRKAELNEIINTVGYVPQHPGALLFDETLTDELAFTRHGPPARRSCGRPPLLERLGLGAVADRNPRDLSGGEQQRASLGRHPGRGPQIILLDEPTRGLDYAQKRRLTDLLLGMKREGRTIIMATHDVELAAACADRVVLMAKDRSSSMARRGR